MPSTTCGGILMATPSVESPQLSTHLRHANRSKAVKTTKTLEKSGKICYDKAVAYEWEVFHKKLSTVRGCSSPDGRYFFRFIAGREHK